MNKSQCNWIIFLFEKKRIEIIQYVAFSDRLLSVIKLIYILFPPYLFMAWKLYSFYPIVSMYYGLFIYYKYFKNLFIYLTAWGFSCGPKNLQPSLWPVGFFSCNMGDLVPWTGVEPGVSVLGVWSFCHWATREVPTINICVQVVLQTSFQLL